MNTRTLQARLNALGTKPPLVVDGIAGAATRTALMAFQKAHNLAPGGVAGPQTLAALALTPDPAVAAAPPWFEALKALQGISETANNATIVGWAKALGGWVGGYFTNAQTIAWCGLTQAHVISLTLPNEPLPSNPLSALAWANFGVPLKKPVLGAILVKHRVGGGHVTEYAGQDGDYYICLGGNQGNRVCEERILASEFIAIRYPKTAPLPS